VGITCVWYEVWYEVGITCHNKLGIAQVASVLASPDSGKCVWSVCVVCKLGIAQAASVLASAESGKCV